MALRYLTRLIFLAAFLEFGGLLVLGTPISTQAGLGFGVDSTGDGDNAGSSSFCDDGTGHCTLRAAIQAANGHPGADFIGITLPAGSVINLTRPLPGITEAVSISAPGPSQLTLRRNTGGNYRILTVTATGTVAISGMTMSNGSENEGAAIMNQGSGTVSITNCILSNNAAAFNGGAINNFSTGTVNLTNSVLTGNTAMTGGAIYNGSHFHDNGAVNLTNCTLSANYASSTGGAIYNGEIGAVTFLNCTVNGNLAGAAGGIYINQGTVNITNSTLNNNVSNSSGGGGMFNNLGTLNLTNSTVAGNIAVDANGGDLGGGIINTGGVVNVRSSIIAGNSAGTSPDVSGSFVSGGFNLIGKTDGSTGFASISDQKGTVAAPLDPKLDPAGLKDNGGPTQTIKLLFGSPAIDKGTSNGLTGQLTTDQRGFTRTFDDPGKGNALSGDGTDIGAFEAQTIPPTVLANISTRMFVETGDNVLIGGFIVTGTEPKKVIVRAIGPSLPVAGKLADPKLELFDSSGSIATNDNWRSTQEGEIIASTVAPTSDAESAIIATLPANGSGYTAIVRGVNNATGVGLVEVYDLNPDANSALAHRAAGCRPATMS